MCVNSRYIFNPYSRKTVLVKCGKCPACLQEKACARANRIRNNVTDGTLTLFVTLTYDNNFVPYVKRSDLESSNIDINVYRDADCRYKYNSKNGVYFEVDRAINVVDCVYVPLEFRNLSETKKLKSLNGKSSDCIGVCLYSDVQNFIKRLRQNLKRIYGFEEKFSYFSCSEYGGCSHRPHFHLLFFVPSFAEETFRHAIVKSWPYADRLRTSKYIEIAQNAASYVSSYVNSNNCLPECLQNDVFRQKHTYSQHFGVVMDCFSLRSILQKVDERALYYYKSKEFDGVSAVNSLPVPEYVINRYFPKHKGFGWLSTSALRRILLQPYDVSYFLKVDNPLYQFTPHEYYQIYVNLENCYQYFHAVTGLNRFDYAQYYIDVWNLYFSTSLEYSFKDIVMYEDYGDFYENLNDVENGLVRAPTLSHLKRKTLNPNERKSVVNSDITMRSLFARMSKQRKVTNYVLQNENL